LEHEETPRKPADITRPVIFMTFPRKKLDKINFKTAASKNKQFTIAGKIKGRKRRITVIVKDHHRYEKGDSVTVDIVTTRSLNRPQAEIWIPDNRDETAGILTPTH
jgi:hypothetical protein